MSNEQRSKLLALANEMRGHVDAVPMDTQWLTESAALLFDIATAMHEEFAVMVFDVQTNMWSYLDVNRMIVSDPWMARWYTTRAEAQYRIAHDTDPRPRCIVCGVVGEVESPWG